MMYSQDFCNYETKGMTEKSIKLYFLPVLLHAGKGEVDIYMILYRIHYMKCFAPCSKGLITKSKLQLEHNGQQIYM